MGACTSKPWEIDLRDICQGLRCFFACCRDKLLFILQTVLKLKTLKKMSKKTYDPRLVWPYSLLLCGPTGCGKTTWIVELLKSHEELCTHMPKKLIWIYGVEQPDLFKTIKEIWAPPQCEFVEGFPEDLMSRLEKTNDRGSSCIFDDVMNEDSSNATISKLFTRGRSHLGCSLVLMLQNIFPKGSQSRTIGINAQYQVLFRNPRDSLQISILARKLCPPIVKTFSKSIKELRKDLMVIYFVVLRNLVLMKSVITQMFYLVNILLSCINFNFILFCI